MFVYNSISNIALRQCSVIRRKLGLHSPLQAIPKCILLYAYIYTKYMLLKTISTIILLIEVHTQTCFTVLHMIIYTYGILYFDSKGYTSLFHNEDPFEFPYIKNSVFEKFKK